MASRVLSFPTDAARRSPAPPAKLSPTAPADAAQPEELDNALGPQLIHSRRPTPGNMTQAQRIAQQVDEEIAHRVQREAAERHAAKQSASAERKAASIPAQATHVGLRHRLLDALLFFARPA